MAMVLNKQTREFIEKLGLTFERMHSTRTAGRMMGLLLVADRPLSLAEMAELLQVSKDRRDYYELTPRSFEQMVVHRIQAIHQFIHLADEGKSAVGDDNTVARTRFDTMKGFYEFFLGELEASLDQWRDRDHDRRE
jgi:hypothetical protein